MEYVVLSCTEFCGIYWFKCKIMDLNVVKLAESTALLMLAES